MTFLCVRDLFRRGLPERRARSGPDRQCECSERVTGQQEVCHSPSIGKCSVGSDNVIDVLERDIEPLRHHDGDNHRRRNCLAKYVA